VVLHSAGGESLLRSFECVKPGGIVVSIGDTPSTTFARSWGMNPILVLVVGLMSRKAVAAARKHEARFEYLFMRPDGEQLRLIAKLVESGAIKPVIDKVFPLERLGDALAYSESGRATGKLVIAIA
jgi:NADPH:quinone reductase-like Zn-dependent oxidoreductase